MNVFSHVGRAAAVAAATGVLIVSGCGHATEDTDTGCRIGTVATASTNDTPCR